MQAAPTYGELLTASRVSAIVTKSNVSDRPTYKAAMRLFSYITVDEQRTHKSRLGLDALLLDQGHRRHVEEPFGSNRNVLRKHRESSVHTGLNGGGIKFANDMGLSIELSEIPTIKQYMELVKQETNDNEEPEQEDEQVDEGYPEDIKDKKVLLKTIQNLSNYSHLQYKKERNKQK